MIDALPSFTNINTIIIKAPLSELEIILDRRIETTKQKLKGLPPSKERRHIRIRHNRNYHDDLDYYYSIMDINGYVPGCYSEVSI